MRSDNDLNAYNIYDLRAMASRRVPKFLFEFVDCGTENEIALLHNREAFNRIKFNPRMLIDVSVRSQEITLFGNKQSMPIAIAPTGMPRFENMPDKLRGSMVANVELDSIYLALP